MQLRAQDSSEPSMREPQPSGRRRVSRGYIRILLLSLLGLLGVIAKVGADQLGKRMLDFSFHPGVVEVLKFFDPEKEKSGPRLEQTEDGRTFYRWPITLENNEEELADQAACVLTF